MNHFNRSIVIFFIIISSLSTSCSRIGPCRLQDDSIYYNQAAANSRDQQILLNLVRLRYRDIPTFLEIGIISTSYTMSKSMKTGFKFGNKVENPFDLVSISPELIMQYDEKPTVTFQPVQGQKFVQELLTPVRISTITYLNSSGWAIDRIFKTCVQKMNNVPNAPSASGPTPVKAPTFEEFAEIVEILRDFQEERALFLIAKTDRKNGDIDLIMKVDRNAVDNEKLEKAWKMLDVELDTDEVRLLPYIGTEREPNDVLLDTRSPMGVLHYLSQAVEVPEADQEKGLVTVTKNHQYSNHKFEWGELLNGVIRIHSSHSCEHEPASVSVNYRGTTFYIADSDLNSKSTFSFLYQLLNLQYSGEKSILPAYTLSIGD